MMVIRQSDWLKHVTCSTNQLTEMLNMQHAFLVNTRAYNKLYFILLKFLIHEKCKLLVFKHN